MTHTKPLVAAMCLSLAGLLLAAEESKEKGTPDRELGLSKTSVFDVTSPEAVSANVSSPGEQPLIGRANSVQPPYVPHGIGDFLPITLESNLCIDCHAVEEKEEGEPTPIPASHYADLRREPDEVEEDVTGARYHCIACHVSVTEAKPLVGNRFEVP